MNKKCIKLNKHDLSRIVRESVNNLQDRKLREASGYDDLKFQTIDRFRSQDPTELPDDELRSAIDYMLAYRWALDGNEDVLNAYIEASKMRDGHQLNESKRRHMKIKQSQLNKLISESIIKVIKEGRINDPDGSLAMMNAGDFMIRMGAKEIQSGQNGGIDVQHMLSQRGAQVLERGRDVCNWIIDVDGRSFCSRHNFSNERQAEKNANKYIKFLERKLRCQVEAYIEGIFKADDEEADIMGCEPGAVTCDTLLTYSSDLGFWMD